MNKGKRKAKPQSKKVKYLLDSLRRKRGVRELAKRFLIVCEDEKSARDYLEALKTHFNLSATSIQIEGSGGNSQPIQVVRKAAMLKKEAAKSTSGTMPFEEVWCVIDGDYGNKINNARSSSEAAGIKLAISTMCFEYWILLHFEESAAPAKKCVDVVNALENVTFQAMKKARVTFAQSLNKFT